MQRSAAAQPQEAHSATYPTDETATTGAGEEQVDDDTIFSADLHIHTEASDGSESYAQILEKARDCGLTHVAFTDHDTLAHIDEACELAKDFGIVAIGGIEISAWDSVRNTKAHILGLGFSSRRAPALRELCAPLLERRRANTLWQAEQLERYGYTLNRAMLSHFDTVSASLYKQHLMAALTDDPYSSRNYQHLYAYLFKGGGICDRDISYVDARDAVEAIKESGGLAVLAHPGEFDNYALVASLVAVGLDGIEKYHPRHSYSDWRLIDQLAMKHHLIRTGGSDYHGAFGAPASPGLHRITLSKADLEGDCAAL
jgi:predicted metal-dependent phosphoesterase TrpH